MNNLSAGYAFKLDTVKKNKYGKFNGFLETDRTRPILRDVFSLKSAKCSMSTDVFIMQLILFSNTQAFGRLTSLTMHDLLIKSKPSK